MGCIYFETLYSQSGLGSNGNKGVLRTPRISRIGASILYAVYCICIAVYLGHTDFNGSVLR